MDAARRGSETSSGWTWSVFSLAPLTLLSSVSHCPGVIHTVWASHPPVGIVPVTPPLGDSRVGGAAGPPSQHTDVGPRPTRRTLHTGVWEEDEEEEEEEEEEEKEEEVAAWITIWRVSTGAYDPVVDTLPYSWECFVLLV